MYKLQAISYKQGVRRQCGQDVASVTFPEILAALATAACLW
jgi:hypothetical protein